LFFSGRICRSNDKLNAKYSVKEWFSREVEDRNKETEAGIFALMKKLYNLLQVDVNAL
jgi:hypothetical protein